MKQFSLIIEIVIKDDKQIILVREPRSGKIVKLCHMPSELASFLSETISSFKANSNSESHE